nr:uncharacterized protein [Tanacetum cinerariifolium]
MKGSGTIKAVNSPSKAIHGVAKDVLAKIDGGKTCMVSTERDAKSGANTLSSMQFKKGLNKSEPCYLAVTRLGTYEGSSKVKASKVIERVLDEFKDVIPKELPKKLLPRREAFQMLRDNKLYMKLEKCSFAQDEVEFLGHKIKDGGLMIDGAKIKAIQDWEPPTKVMELRSFIGLVNYYGRFIMGYSAITSSLMDLLKKNKAWIWDEECQAEFESLKKAVMEEPMLRLPDVTMPFELHTYASDFAIGGVLMQDGHLIAFESQKLNETKRKYTVQEKKMTMVVHWLRIWRHYLLGLRFVIKTDNIATSYFQTQKKLSPKQAHWALLDGVDQDHGDGFELLHEFSILNRREIEEGECTIRDLFSEESFELVTGRQPLTPNTLAASYEGSSLAAYKTIEEWHEYADLAWESLDKAGKKMKKWADEKRRYIDFEVGDQVMVMLLPQQFKSLRKLKIHPVFHVSFLKPYHEDEEDPERWVSKRVPTAVVTLYDQEVEEIMSDRTIRRREVTIYKKYLIMWRDLPDSKASWEAEDLLWQFADEIKRYHENGMMRTS